MADVVPGGGAALLDRLYPGTKVERVTPADAADMLIDDGLVPDAATVSTHVDLIDALHREPERLDLRWRLGVDRQVAVDELRHTEVRKLIEHLVRPTRDRGR